MVTTSCDPSTPGLLAPGTLLGGVRIERLLTRSAMGALYLAFDEADGAPLAVKAVALGQPGDPALAGAQGRFQRETLSAVRLHHPGIVTTHGAILQGGMGYIAMELLTGTDLGRYTRPARLLPEALTLAIAARIAEALAYAHRAGVVHRDVKPANVMFDPAVDSVKLTDFGLARAVDAEATRSGVLLGWVAGDMAVTDPIDKPWVDLSAAFLHWGAPLAGAIGVVVLGKWLAARKTAARAAGRRRHRRRRPRRAPTARAARRPAPGRCA